MEERYGRAVCQRYVRRAPDNRYHQRAYLFGFGEDLGGDGAATHLGEAEIPLQLIMGKTRHKNPRTAMRYVKPGVEAIVKVTEVLAPHRRTH